MNLDPSSGNIEVISLLSAANCLNPWYVGSEFKRSNDEICKKCKVLLICFQQIKDELKVETGKIVCIHESCTIIIYVNYNRI